MPPGSPFPPAAPAPPATPGPGNDDSWPDPWARFEDETLVLTNQRRAQGAVCGDKSFAPAPPLTFHPLLRKSARGHSRDMGQRSYFSHTNPDGKTPSDRAKAVGHPNGVGENIFAGPRTPAEVVDGWMKSPGHCSNIMATQYRTLGVGYAEVQGSPLTRYWTQNFSW